MKKSGRRLAVLPRRWSLQGVLTQVSVAVLALAMSISQAVAEVDRPTLATAPSTEHPVPRVVSAETIRDALRAEKEYVYKTLLGALVVRLSDDATDTPGKILLNGELIYTARQQEALPQHRGMPFNLRVVSFQGNEKKFPEFRITRMVVEESSWTCQFVVLDFTGEKVWISERFPKEAVQNGPCMDMTWARSQNRLAYFYFGADESDWKKGRYQGWVKGYNLKLKAVFGPVDAPPPPRDVSLVPKLKPR